MSHTTGYEDGGWVSLATCNGVRIEDDITLYAAAKPNEAPTCPRCGKHLVLHWDVRILEQSKTLTDVGEDAMLKIEQHDKATAFMPWNQFKVVQWPGLTDADYREVLHLPFGGSAVFGSHLNPTQMIVVTKL